MKSNPNCLFCQDGMCTAIPFLSSYCNPSAYDIYQAYKTTQLGETHSRKPHGPQADFADNARNNIEGS